MACCCKHTQGIRKTQTETTVALTKLGHSPARGRDQKGKKGRKRTHRGDPGGSSGLYPENGTVRKCLALLGIQREAGTGARIALPSTTGDWFFGRKYFGSSGRTRTYNPSVNSYLSGCIYSNLAAYEWSPHATLSYSIPIASTARAGHASGGAVARPYARFRREPQAV